jgi:hypothetical protein
VAPKSVSRAMQRQIELTTAVCQERLLATHVRHSLALVDLVSDSLPFDDALDIYVRVLRLNAEQARNIGSRALAELGRRSGLQNPDEAAIDGVRRLAAEAEARSEEAAEVAEAEERRQGADESRSGAVFSRLRRRLQGRVHSDLRYRINLAAARTEDDLFLTHIDNAMLFIKTLADEVPAPEAVDLYLDAMVLGESMGDMIYNRALRQLADQVLPPVPRSASGRDSATVPVSTEPPADRAESRV